MRTIGTGNLEAMTNADLRTYIASLALDVYEATIIGLSDFELAFALGTLDRFRNELDRRVGIAPHVALEVEAARQIAELDRTRAAFPPKSMLDTA